MKGIVLCLLVILAVDAVRSQGRATRTKKGSRPVRRGGGMRPVAAPAPRPVPMMGRPAPPPAPMAKPAPPAYGVKRIPGVMTRTKKGRRPARFNPFAPPPMAPPMAPPMRHAPPMMRPVPKPAVPARNPMMNMFQYMPQVPQAPLVPQVACDTFCSRQGFKAVCSIFGNQYDNDCYLQCSGEPRQCENPCPCQADGKSYTGMADPMLGPSCQHCYNEEGYNPVCVDDETTLYNECEAMCLGKTITCSSTCPC